MLAAVNLSALQAAADSNQWVAVFPELMLGCIALALLVLELVLPKAQRALIPAVALVSLLAVLVGVAINFHTAFLNSASSLTFGGLLRHTEGGQFMRVFFLLSALLVCLLGMITLDRQPVPRTEFYHIVLVVTAALMLLVQSNHFVMFFVALETVTVGFYILVSYFRTSAASLEAGLKYLILGALSSAILLFGIVLLYGVAGNRALPGATAEPMSFGALRGFLAANPDNFLANIGALLVLAGVAFKIGAVPFQIWIPDVYQGAPTPVTAFLAVASKAGGFAVLLLLVLGVFSPLQDAIVPVLSVMAAATILFGNLAALSQHNVKRLMGLSGISHAGYLLLGVIAAIYREPLAVGAVYFYLLAYLLASFAVFAVMAHVAGDRDADQELEHYANLARERPFLGAVLAVGLGSLAGIPPLAGFMGKLLVFIAAFKAGLYGLLLVAVAGVVISIYYYFGWMRAAFFPTPEVPAGPGETPAPAVARVGLAAGTAMVVLAVASVVLGFYQGAIGEWLVLR
ncbi:MAG TPA: NADH-quinone oxidoreductase subunit N [Opitutaceae bacterium]|nr:NADH-quinone oxidoreductase subunit N [Opitutaceae bacterium]